MMNKYMLSNTIEVAYIASGICGVSQVECVNYRPLLQFLEIVVVEEGSQFLFDV